MNFKDKLAAIQEEFDPSYGTDLAEMKDDIYYYFSQMEGFEVLRIEQTDDAERMVLAACLTTIQDPFFKIVVANIWQKDLAFDEEWSEFESNDLGTVFRFITWADGYISGEIWFERAKKEIE